MLNARYRSGTQVFALHDRGVQLERAIGSHSGSNACVEQRIALEVVDHSHHRLATIATSSQDLITDHQSRIQRIVVLLSLLGLLLQRTHRSRTTVHYNYILTFLCHRQRRDHQRS